MNALGLAFAIVLLLLIVVIGLWWRGPTPPPPPPPPPKPLILYGVGGETLYAATPSPSGAPLVWTAVGPSARTSSLAFNPADGRLYGVDPSLNLLSAVPGQDWAPVPNGVPPEDRLASVEFDGAGRLWGITTGNRLVTKGGDPSSAWGLVVAPMGSNVYAFAFDAGGAMWGVARGSGATFRKDAPTAPWVPVPGAGRGLYNVHIDRTTGAFYGIGGPWQLYTSPDLATSPWAAVAGPNLGIQDIAVSPARP